MVNGELFKWGKESVEFQYFSVSSRASVVMTCQDQFTTETTKNTEHEKALMKDATGLPGGSSR
jgi:hypothetical protein